MTISICWQRKFLGVDEIIFASDSRLSAGYRWDCAQKIFPIEGPNFCISFAGSADFAFPCIFQFQRMVKSYDRYTCGAAPISEMAKGFLAIVNQLFSLVDDQAIAQFNQTQFLFSGYDFETGIPFQRCVRHNAKTGRYERHGFGGIKSGGIEVAVGFAGDLRNQYFAILGKMLNQQKTQLNYQPLEALNELLLAQGKNSPVGGMPQVVKVYKHRNYLPYAVTQTRSEGNFFLFGRPLLPYEKVFYPVIAMDRFGFDDLVYYPRGAPNRILAQPPSLVDFLEDSEPHL